jgi:polyhydroxybutyrate depolymerase
LRRASRLVVVALAAVAAVACSRAGTAAAVRGTELPPVRSFEPSGLAAGELRPLIIFLHGLGSSAEEVLDEPPLGSFGARHGVFVVVPDGAVDQRGRRFWNAGPACCDFDHTGIDDVGRLTALVDAWRSHPGVDPRRIYVMGFSNGGFMAHRLACRIGGRLAAVASIGGAGPEASERCDLATPVAVLEVHGDGDRIVRPDGGRVFGVPGMAPYPAQETSLADWARRLGCVDPAPTRTLDLDPRIPGPETAVAGFRRCRLGNVELWTVRGGLHAVGTPELFEEAWRFLARHAKPGP